MPEWLGYLLYNSVPEWLEYLATVLYNSVPEWLEYLLYNSVPEWLGYQLCISVPEWLEYLRYGARSWPAGLGRLDRPGHSSTEPFWHATGE